MAALCAPPEREEDDTGLDTSDTDTPLAAACRRALLEREGVSAKSQWRKARGRGLRGQRGAANACGAAHSQTARCR